MALSVALLSPPYATLSYAAPDRLPEDAFASGLRVFVPVGRTVRMGVVLGRGDPPPGIDLRPVVWPAEREPLLGGGYVAMIEALAARQLVPPGRILGTVVPAGLRSTAVRFAMPGTRPVPVHGPIDGAMADAWMAGTGGWVSSGREDGEERCVLLRDPPWPLRPGAHRQSAVLEWIYDHPGGTRSALAKAVPGASAVLAVLVRNGLVAVGPAEREPAGPPPVPDPAPRPLTPDQRRCADRFARDIADGRFAMHLLYGVTGSGKTRVYLAAVRACLAAGRTAMLLAPEIALALKLRRDVGTELGMEPVLYHGCQTPSTRAATFASRSGGPKVIVGTRSALFLPVPDPGLIVLDEEHDASFKQDEGLTYQAKEVAYFLARQAGAVLLLGSATPDVKTFHAALTGGMELSRLPDRIGEGGLPEVRLVDIHAMDHAGRFLADETVAALKECVGAGHQAMILLNRRGYAPRMVCTACGKALRCPRCDIGLTYHKARDRMVCHYCGYAAPFPMVCPSCGAMEYVPMGQGTERVQETLDAELPGGRVLRLDRDSARREGMAERILDAFARREADVLVGTQMLSKGHHFPDVTLVVVADGDIGLNVPDYRATERTFQLLVQAAGRAGRGDHPGKVIVQTRDPSHYCWNFVRTADYEGFYEQELARRRKRGYPPFVKLAVIRLSYPVDWDGGAAETERLAAVLVRSGREHGVRILGPAPASHELLRERRRLICMLKAGDWSAVRAVYADLLGAGPDAAMRISLDLDPVSSDE